MGFCVIKAVLPRGEFLTAALWRTQANQYACLIPLRQGSFIMKFFVESAWPMAADTTTISAYGFRM